MIPFYDENGKLKLSIQLDDLLFLEASDNYVSINYIHNQKISKYMVRNTLKIWNLNFRILTSCVATDPF